jgi:hypothetical protein
MKIGLELEFTQLNFAATGINMNYKSKKHLTITDKRSDDSDTWVEFQALNIYSNAHETLQLGYISKSESSIYIKYHDTASPNLSTWLEINKYGRGCLYSKDSETGKILPFRGVRIGPDFY